MMRGNISCARKYLYSARKTCNPPYIYIIWKLIHCAQKLIYYARKFMCCAEIYSLCMETHVLRGNIFKSPQIFWFVRGNYYVPCADFGLLTILGMPSSRDYVIDLMLAVSASQVDFWTPLHIVFQTNLILSYLISWCSTDTNAIAPCFKHDHF